MPQTTKDSQGGKNHPVKETSTNSAKRVDKASADTTARFLFCSVAD